MRPQIPDELATQIDRMYQDYGYTSKTEFVVDSIRRRLEELDELHPEENDV
jgi:metal-responsive CopG/Arc/MetJ family transcriptional regulator